MLSNYDKKGLEGFLETLAAILWEQMLVTSKVLVSHGDIFLLTLSMRNVTADLGHLCPRAQREEMFASPLLGMPHPCKSFTWCLHPIRTRWVYG